MELTFLGTGTSTGIPVLGCRCPVCTSTDQRDRRLRASAMVRPYADAPAILIDAGPDLRQQLLAQRSPELGALLITHIHYDHVGGLDDLRPYCARSGPEGFPVYCRPEVGRQLHRSLPYTFASEDHYPGAPVFNLHEIADDNPFEVRLAPGRKVEVLPLPVLHGKLPILGYRIGPLAYITDCSHMPSETFDRLRGLDTLVINALRLKEHMSHFTLAQALEVIEKVKPTRAFLTHMCHDMPRTCELDGKLPPNVALAIDGQVVEIFA